MKRRANRDTSGFIMSLLINMVLRYEWPAAAIILVVIWMFTKVRLLIWLAFACLMIWFLLSLAVTALLSAVSNIPEDQGMAENKMKQDQRAEEIKEKYLNKKKD